MPELAVIVVSYNVRTLLRECLQTLERSVDRSRLDAHVIVVDNASRDGSAAMVREEFPDVDVMEPGENLGFAGGNNYALRRLGFPDGAATPEAVWLLNPDTEVVGDAPAQLLARLQAAPRVGAVGPTLQYGDGRFQHGAFAFPGLAQILFDLFPVHPRLLDTRLNGRYPRRRYERGEPFRVDMLLGAALMLRGETIHDVGLLDDGYFMYAEELDWCRRTHEAGWAVEVVPSAEVVHHVGQSTQQFREEMFSTLWRSRLRYYEKFHSRPYVALVRTLVRLGLAYRHRTGRHSHDAEGPADSIPD